MSIAVCPVNIRGKYEGYPVVAVATLVSAPSWMQDGKYKVLIRYTDVAGHLRWVGMENFEADPDQEQRK